jgi:hypothetical protein
VPEFGFVTAGDDCSFVRAKCRLCVWDVYVEKGDAIPITVCVLFKGMKWT